jgi:membrane fusion protein (multidrug efflux system)
MKLHLNQPADVIFDALDGKSFPGRVAQINPSADLQSRQFTVRVALNNRARRFSPGMFARVALVVDAVKGTLAVPREAVQQDRDGSRYVMAAQPAKDGKGMQAVKRPVIVNAEDADWVGIAAGVNPGEKVVTMSAAALKDGQAIRAGGGRSGKGRPGGPGASGDKSTAQPDGGRQRK